MFNEEFPNISVFFCYFNKSNLKQFNSLFYYYHFYFKIKQTFSPHAPESTQRDFHKKVNKLYITTKFK